MYINLNFIHSTCRVQLASESMSHHHHEDESTDRGPQGKVFRETDHLLVRLREVSRRLPVRPQARLAVSSRSAPPADAPTPELILVHSLTEPLSGLCYRALDAV
ncbi:hypothetical protein R5R35_006933 [Gryllus longicercus]|uniref:Uncharacterized protein n=1 Tax=Gryllus longicercus TaxID=2509291 RepID=A0AAN9Z0Z3_9ORTH